MVEAIAGLVVLLPVAFYGGVRFATRRIPAYLASLEPEELKTVAQQTAEARQ